MTTNFPSGLDNFGPDPSPTSPRNAPSLAGSVSNLNDSVEAIEAALGVNLGNIIKNSGSVIGIQAGPIAARPAANLAAQVVWIATDTFLLSYSNGTVWDQLAPSSLTKTVTVPATVSISGALNIANGAQNYLPPFFVPIPSTTVSATIVGVQTTIRAGTSVTFSINKNGTAVGGLGAVSATTAPTYIAATSNNVCGNGDQIALVISGVSGNPDGLSASIIIAYAV